MKQVQEMPQAGQFVAIWVYDEKLWSGTFCWVNGKLFEYHEYYPDEEDNSLVKLSDDFVSPVTPGTYIFNFDCKFFVQ